MDFSTSTFWIQIHGLLVLWQNKENLRKIGEKVGKVEEVDLIGDDNNHGWMRFVRARVKIELSKPLRAGFFLPREGGLDVWIGIKYEKAADFCFTCGLLGHNRNSCSKDPIMHLNPFGIKFKPFGP